MKICAVEKPVMKLHVLPEAWPYTSGVIPSPQIYEMDLTPKEGRAVAVGIFDDTLYYYMDTHAKLSEADYTILNVLAGVTQAKKDTGLRLY